MSTKLLVALICAVCFSTVGAFASEPAGGLESAGFRLKSPQEIQSRPKSEPSAPSTSGIKEASDLFDAAKQQMQTGNTAEANRLWQKYISVYSGMPGYEDALFHYANTLIQLGRSKDAIDPLKSVVLSSTEPRRQVDARLALADCLLDAGDTREALALTFELLPDKKAEDRVGFHRRKNEIGTPSSNINPDYAQKVRLFTLRGRIFASLGESAAAREALERAQNLLGSASTNDLSNSEKTLLSAHWARRQLETLKEGCLKNHPIPKRLSESEFLSYADAFYKCAAPARELYCKVLAAHDELIRKQTVDTYRELAEAPLKMRDHLPPPARPIKKKEQRVFYEQEMRLLISTTVRDRTASFRRLDECGTANAF